MLTNLQMKHINHEAVKSEWVFSFFLAVSVMRYSASAFGFAVSSLKCPHHDEVLHGFPRAMILTQSWNRWVLMLNRYEMNMGSTTLGKTTSVQMTM